MTTTKVIWATIKFISEPITLNKERVMFGIKTPEWEGKEDTHPMDNDIFYWLTPEEADNLHGGYSNGDWQVVNIKSREEVTIIPDNLEHYIDQLEKNLKEKTLLIKELRASLKKEGTNVSTSN